MKKPLVDKLGVYYIMDRETRETYAAMYHLTLGEYDPKYNDYLVRFWEGSARWTAELVAEFIFGE